jgi:uncharacterized repeat protein (TIGR01451 family)
MRHRLRRGVGALVGVCLSFLSGPLAAENPVPPYGGFTRLLGVVDASRLRYGTLGAAVSISGETMVVGAPEEDTEAGRYTGAAYVYVRSSGSWTLQARLGGSQAEEGDRFGTSVSLDGDTVVIGSPHASGIAAGSGPGKAYVFTRSNGTWTEQQRVTVPDADVLDFGFSVSLSGGVMAVGTPSTGAVGAGAVFVFERAGATWIRRTRMNGTHGAAEGSYFGWSVGVSGDTLLVGAPQEDGPVVPAGGAAHVFVRTPAGSWNEQATLGGTAGHLSGEEFGFSVSLAGNTALVGAPSPAGVARDGAAHVFVRSGGTWSEQQTLGAEPGVYHVWTGASVIVAGDTALVGSPGGRNAASLFVRTQSTWARVATLVPSDLSYSRWCSNWLPPSADGGCFGSSVAIGNGTIVVGAPTAQSRAGKVYAYRPSPGGWTEGQALVLTRPDYTAGDSLGKYVAVSGSRVVASAPGDEGGESSSRGSVYVFTRSAGSWTKEKLKSPNALGSFGTSVAVSGDIVATTAYGGEGPAGHGSDYVYAFERAGESWRGQVVAGSFTENIRSVAISGNTLVAGGTPKYPYYDNGSVYVFVRDGTTWSLQQHLQPPVMESYDNFGSSVSISGDTLVVSDPVNVRTFVFQRTGSNWVPQFKTLPAWGPVSISGDTILVGPTVFVRTGTSWTKQQVLAAGAPGFVRSVQVSGDRAVLGIGTAVYVFDRRGTTWTETQRLVSPDAPGQSGFFGVAGFSDGFLAVGDPSFDAEGGIDSGVVYAYDSPTADLWIRTTDGRAASIPGQAVNYTITVGNEGPGAVSGALVADALPPVLECTTTCSGTGGASCRPGPFDGSIADSVAIPAGQSVTYASACMISASATGTLSNTATVTPPPSVMDRYPGNNSSTDTDTLDPAADLALALRQSRDTVDAGEVLDYLITITNLGPWPSTGTTLTDVLPSDTTFVASIPGPSACAVQGQTLECSLGPLAPGETGTVTVEVEVSAGARGVLRSTASVAGHEPDPVGKNDSAVASALVSAPTEFFTIEPCRLVDTREGSTAPIGGPALGAQSTRVFAMGGHCGIPMSARAVALNVTVIGAGADGNLRLFPAGLSVPVAATVSYGEGQTRGNNAVVTLNGNGEIAAFVAQAARTKVQVIIDVTGYFE